MNRIRNFLSRLRRDDRGATMIEYGLMSALIAIQVGYYMAAASEEERDNSLLQEAQQLAAFHQAISSYVYANAETLETTTQAGPIDITASTLVTDGFLPSTWTNQSIKGHQFIAGVVREDAFKYRYVTYLTGGTPYSDSDVSLIASSLGAFGAGIYSNDDENVRTNGGLIIEPIADYASVSTPPTVGYPAIVGRFGFDGYCTDYLSRSNRIDMEECNRMHADLDMNTKDAFGATEFRPDGINKGEGLDAEAMTGLNELVKEGITEGDACDYAGGARATIQQESQTVLRCDPDSGTWQSIKAEANWWLPGIGF